MPRTTAVPGHASGTGAATTVAEYDAELERLAATDCHCADAHWQLRAALDAYHQHRDHDLSGARVELIDQPLDDIATTYNYTAATNVTEYAARFAGRLTGEDLQWQIDWYTNLVAAAAAGELPPILVHDDGTHRYVVDGGHRLSAHRAAGLTSIAAYLVRP